MTLQIQRSVFASISAPKDRTFQPPVCNEAYGPFHTISAHVDRLPCGMVDAGPGPANLRCSNSVSETPL